MPLSAKSAYLLYEVMSHPDTYGPLDCATAVEKLQARFTTNNPVSLGRVATFDRDGLYVLTLDVAGGGGDIFQHFVGIFCVDGEKTIYQAWVGQYGTATWLLGPPPAPNIALQACVTAYSPASPTY